MADPKIAVVVPAFNEARTLRVLVDRLFHEFNGHPIEVLVVDDGSTDETPQLLGQLTDPRIRTLTHERNQGKGAALRTALAAASGEIILIQDADLEYDPKDISILLEPILAGHADAVFGTRFHGRAAGPFVLASCCEPLAHRAFESC